jgi:3-methyladenine DNA glycosylase AlkD
MDALEPVVRKDPDTWLRELGTWLDDNHKWVRRASVTVIGRLPMKYPAYTEQCLEFNECLLLDTDVDVRKAVSFAIRICAKANPRLVCEFLKQRVPSSNPAAVWGLCDVKKSMDRKIIGEFRLLLPYYEKWSETPGMSSRDLRSIESAIKVLRRLQF